MTLEHYIENLNAKYKLGNATQHTFKGFPEQLIESKTKLKSSLLA